MLEMPMISKKILEEANHKLLIFINLFLSKIRVLGINYDFRPHIKWITRSLSHELLVGKILEEANHMISIFINLSFSLSL